MGRYIMRFKILSMARFRCAAMIHYDHNDNTYDMNYNSFYSLPIIYIRGDLGTDIMDALNIDEHACENWLKFKFDQAYEEDVTSYNVIGEIQGVNPDETVIVGCLYDCWWNQGTVDSAIGIGIMLSIAKYFKDNNIVPNRNIKFVAFSGEEFGLKGAYHYESLHRYDENVVTYIDLNQLGMDQTDPRLRFVVASSNKGLNHTMRGISNLYDYADITDDVADFWLRTLNEFNYPSDHQPFQEQFNKGKRSCDIINFIEAHEDRKWYYHHRDGMNHNEGDVMSHYNVDNVKAAMDIIWATIDYLVVKT